MADFAATLDDLRAGTADAVEALTAVVARALPGVDLAALEAREAQGIDIAADLDAAGLTRTGFRYLHAMAALAAAGTVTGAEWADTIAVLTAAHKVTLIPSWRTEETAFVLSPEVFVVGGTGPAGEPAPGQRSGPGGLAVGAAGPDRPRQDVLDAGTAAVAAAEQAGLPILRDALLADFSATAAAGTDAGEQLSARFFVDMLAGGSLRTTRIRQAIESVQSLLLAKRSGQLAADHPAAAWAITDLTAFSNAWVWMGEWASWRSATQAFLFPERHLDRRCWFLRSAPISNRHWHSCSTACGAADRSAARPRISSPRSTWPGRSARRSRTATRCTARRTRRAAGRSAQTPEPVNREAFWVVPMLLAQRLQSAGDFAAALDWYWLLYPYDVDRSGLDLRPDQPRDRVRARPDLPVDLDATAEPVHAGRAPPRPVHPGDPAGDHPLPRGVRRCRVHPGDRRVGGQRPRLCT